MLHFSHLQTLQSRAIYSSLVSAYIFRTGPLLKSEHSGVASAMLNQLSHTGHVIECSIIRLLIKIRQFKMV